MLTVGTKVRANWMGHGHYFLGRVHALTGTRPVTVTVRYDDDGSFENLPMDSIIGRLVDWLLLLLLLFLLLLLLFLLLLLLIDKNKITLTGPQVLGAATFAVCCFWCLLPLSQLATQFEIYPNYAFLTHSHSIEIYAELYS